MKCSVQSCLNQSITKGLCVMHYTRIRRHGSLVNPEPNRTGRPRSSPEQRFWSMVDRNSVGDCWLWLGATKHTNYPNFCLGGRWGKSISAHRFAYNLLIGTIPTGMQIDHLCRNTHCVNPSHMEVVTPRVNMLRGLSPAAKNAQKTHCKRGHPFTTENTRIENGSRRCKACRRDTRRKR